MPRPFRSRLDAPSPFHLKLGKASDAIPLLAQELKASAVVCDMSPLRAGPLKGL